MKRLFTLLLSCAFLLINLTVSVVESAGPNESNASNTNISDKIPAFPGAEGGGMYTTGGRGGDVYEVTNLNDSGPGSLREGLKKSNITIVFKVSGIIELKSTLGITGSNVTIAGQTAPGDGICIKNYETEVAGNNIIVRYIRFRPGDEKKAEGDAFTGRYLHDIIIDHSSMSWGNDEVCTFYENKNVTIQWSIISESLTMSVHFKGRHGYGGGFGGVDVSFLNNILAHHSSRNLRIDAPSGNAVAGSILASKIDVRNNIIYNYGFNTSYGGEPDIQANFVNNYYKYGPDTQEDVKKRVYDEVSADARLYLNGNYVDGYSDVTADNWKGVSKVGGNTAKLTAPLDIYPTTTKTAEEAYELVLKNAGAILPVRDSVDARIVGDVRNRTGRQIDSQSEVGGWPVYNSAEPKADSDHDGMPDEWETGNGLDLNNSDDRNNKGSDGYTNLEKYLNSITANSTVNPVIKIKSPEMNKVLAGGSTLNIETEVSDSDGQIAKVEFFDGTQKVGEATGKPYNFKLQNIKDGTHYISAVATDNSGTKTQTSVIRIFANDKTAITPWVSQDIGNTRIPGAAVLKDNVLSIRGSGNIGGATSDTFHYAYQKLSGDGEMSALIKSYIPIIEAEVSGIMIRSSLNDNAQMAYAGMMYEKTTSRRIEFGTRKADGDKSTAKSIELKTGTPVTIKLVREGNKFTAYYSQKADQWEEVGSAEIEMPKDVYIGFATDAGQRGDVENSTFSKAEFANINYTGDITKAPAPKTKSTQSGLLGSLDNKAAIGAIVGVILIAAVILTAMLLRRK